MTVRDRDPYNDGLTIESTDVTVALDQDAPFGPYNWDTATQRWRTQTRVETAVSVHHTLHGEYTCHWYRSNLRGPFGFGPPRYRWRSTEGGSLAPASLVGLLDYALTVRTGGTP
jgi:hypothetical protein